MRDITYREYTRSDAASWLKLHDSVFPPIARDYWDRWSAREDVTAVVAVRDGEIVGTIPFQVRDYVIRPGAAIRAAFEYSVCVREDLRGLGVGSAMMTCAKDILKPRADALMVFRGEETVPAYRFYALNEHYDLVFARAWTLEETQDRPPGKVDLHPIEELYRREKEVLEVFESAFPDCGGYALRRPGFWRPMLENCNWEEVKHDMRFFCFEREDRIIAYAVAGKQTGQPVVRLMELVTRDADTARARMLLNAVAAFAGALQSKVEAFYPESGMYADAFRAVGFAPCERGRTSMMIMAHPLNAEAVAGKAWVKSEALKDADVSAWSPRYRVTLHKAAEAGRRIILEMKDDLLARLVFCRLDLRAAYEADLVSVVGGGRAEVEAVAAALPFTRWEYQHIEMI